MPLPELLSSPQAAALLGCSAKTVHRLVADEKLTPYVLGPGGPYGAFMFKRSDVERLAKQRGARRDPRNLGRRVTDIAS